MRHVIASSRAGQLGSTQGQVVTLARSIGLEESHMQSITFGTDPVLKPLNTVPVVMNTCYSFVDAKNVIHVASVHQYDEVTKTVQPVKGAGGVSMARNEIEGKAAIGWARNIWADMLT